MFRINDLQRFVNIASCTTLGEGSRRLNITLAARSESIRRLEADRNCILFYRTRAGVALTPSGKKILDEAKVLLATMKRVEA